MGTEQDRGRKMFKEERQRFIEKARKVLDDPNAKWVSLEEFLKKVRESE